MRKTIEGSDTMEYGSAAIDMVEGVKKKLNGEKSDEGGDDTERVKTLIAKELEKAGNGQPVNPETLVKEV